MIPSHWHLRCLANSSQPMLTLSNVTPRHNTTKTSTKFLSCLAVAKARLGQPIAGAKAYQQCYLVKNNLSARRISLSAKKAGIRNRYASNYSLTKEAVVGNGLRPQYGSQEHVIKPSQKNYSLPQISVQNHMGVRTFLQVLSRPWRLWTVHSGGCSMQHFHSSGRKDLNLKTVEKWKPGTMAQIEVPTMSNLAEFEDKLFDYLCDDDGTLKISTFKDALISTGLRESDPRLRECMQALTHTRAFIQERNINSDGTTIGKDYFKECISKNIVIIAKAFQNQMIVPDFGTFCEQIDEMYWTARENIGGKVATYIPQLARYSPKLWGVSVCTIDGQRYSVGDVNVPFCLQSSAKPLNYAMVLDDLTPEVVHQYVGHEPSGTSFNTISLDYKDKPHNPMINAGAIALCSLLKQELNQADRFDYATQMYKRLAGGEYLAFNNSVFLSEKETADRNFALAYYMREKKCFPQGTNLMEVLDFYFQLCSLEVTCESGSVIAATLANGGICPITGDKVFSARAVRDTLSLMLSCGMYDYSGEFAFKVGLPAKSGVSGGILLVVPNKMGMFVWSPALDSWGNSVRGVQFSQGLVSKFNFHHYDNLRFTQKKIDPCRRKIEKRATDVVNLLFSSYNNDVSALRRFALGGLDMDQSDYDGRTALHIAAAEGHNNIVHFLIDKCKCSPFVEDRWGFKPIDDAQRFKHTKVAKTLELAMATFDADAKIDRRFQAIDSTKYGEVTFGGDATYVTKLGLTDQFDQHHIDQSQPKSDEKDKF